MLQLNSTKKKKLINWECKLNLKQATKFTIQWYKEFYNNREKILDLSIRQIQNFEKIKELKYVNGFSKHNNQLS